LSEPVSAISTATPINGIDSAGIAAILSENGVFGVSMVFSVAGNIFLLVPLIIHLTSMVIFKKFPGS
jgi:hypothetical protein